MDGLRAYAVVAVILFHLHVWPFTGGYVGVDVFFVISGFLITRLILTEMERGDFSFSNFYLRRVRRLFPAFFVTLLISFIAGCVLFSPEHLQRLGKSIVAASFAVPNFFFWSEAGYFDLDAEFKPLLHTWSLGVEEQFYLVWPLALVLLLQRGGNRAVLIALGVLSAISLISAQLFLPRDSEAIFYLPFFRIYEFGIGAALVWVVRFQFRRNVLSEVCLGLGLTLIAYTVFAYTDATTFPGLAALLPCIGTAMAIHSGRAPILGKLIGNRLAVGVGLISYSLYLIHLPLVVFYKYWSLQPLGTMEKAALIIISVIMAVAMHRFVERPFRRPKHPANWQFLRGSAVSMLLLVLVAHNVTKDGWDWRLPDRLRPVARLVGSFNVVDHCDKFQSFERHDICYFGADHVKSVDLVIFGDSHGEMLTPGLDPYLTARNKAAVLVTASGTLPFYTPVKSETQRSRIFSFRESMEKFSELRPKLVILHAQWGSEKVGPWKTAEVAFVERLNDTLRYFSKNNINVLLIGAVPELGEDPGKCFARTQILPVPTPNITCARLSARKSLQKSEEVNKLIRIESIKYKTVHFFDPKNIFCHLVKEGYCDIFMDGKILYRDSNHISTFGSEIMINKIKEMLEKI